MIHDSEDCQCFDCMRRRYYLLDGAVVLVHHVECPCTICCKERTEEAMRSNKPKTIEVSVVRGKVPLPAYLTIFQRHFEKAKPFVGSPPLMGRFTSTVNAPIDLIDLLVPADLRENIESIEVIYEKGV